MHIVAARWSWLIFAAGALCMIGVVPLGKSLEGELSRVGLFAYQAQTDTNGRLLTFFFALGFPIGVALCVLGSLLRSERSALRLLVWSLVALAIGASALLVPALFGRHPHPTFFGTGGVLILVLVIVALGCWGLYRARLPRTARAAADWQGAGYLAFAAAAWNLCGFGGMPGYAVYPERMITLDAQAFATGQLKTTMALLILGWLFSAIGLGLASRSAAQRATC